MAERVAVSGQEPATCSAQWPVALLFTLLDVELLEGRKLICFIPMCPYPVKGWVMLLGSVGKRERGTEGG